MSVLSNYQVNFGVRIFFNTEFEFMRSINDSLDGFIVEINNSSRGDQLLNSVNSALSNPNPNSTTTYPAQSLMLAVIKNSSTIIYDEMDNYENPNHNPDYELPTSDFKVIVEAWRDFLISRGK